MTKLFVYGTLVPHAPAWPILQPWTTGAAVDDAVRGHLYDTGRGYPAATFDRTARAVVHGVVVELDARREAAALAALDEYEAAEYVRALVVTERGIEALTYAWAAPLAACVRLRDGRWRAS
jgi:gamma-glutamylcyclotransferase (GGCT)/AIG2-like uncharacterized protein YtfP